MRPLFLFLVVFLNTMQAWSQSGYDIQRIAQAPVDEWFFGIGDSRNTYLPNVSLEQQVSPPKGGVAKRNGGYVWAMAAVEDYLWFSSLSNGWCGWMMVTGQFMPTQNSRWACETFRSAYPSLAEAEEAIPWPEGAATIQADWRPPGIYRLNVKTNEVQRIVSDHPVFTDMLGRSFGFRAAGSADGLVFMASNPLVRGDESVFILAFDGVTGEFVDGVQLPGYVNVRRFRNVSHADGRDAMYVFVGSEMHSSAHPNHLLRWVGSREKPFDGEGKGFEIVGDLGDAGSGVELLEHDGRFVLTTWGSETVAAGLYQSSPFPDGGFTASQPARFTKVFDAADFDPDPVIAMSWLIGALEIFDGYIYWGSMHPNGQGFQQLVMDSPGILFSAREAILKSHRATHVFRTRLGEEPVTELLYGKEILWAYVNGEWVQRSNRLGMEPLYGDAGFGAEFNDYTWTMIKYRGSLYVGTFDVSGGLKAIQGESDCWLSCYVLRTLAEHADLDAEISGYDLYRFDDSASPAVAVTKDGFANPSSNGVRNAFVAHGNLYIGTSSYSNLDVKKGGWELLKLRPTEQE